MKHATVLAITTVAALCGATPASAQANRTFVSGQGADSNPCSLSAPCRSFAQAITQTNPGGEIAVLDTAGYGAVTITKAVSIVNQDGVEAGVTVSSGDAITVAAGASDVVSLRGLTVVGLGTGGNGITFSSGQSLRVDKCEIRGFIAGGILMQTMAAANLTVTDTTVANNLQGVLVSVSGTLVATTVALARLHATGNSDAGVAVTPHGTLSVVTTVTDSLLDNNGTDIRVSATTATALVTVDNSKLLFTTTAHGVSASGNSGVWENGSLFGVGADNSFSGGAQLVSFGNNHSIASGTTF